MGSGVRDNAVTFKNALKKTLLFTANEECRQIIVAVKTEKKRKVTTQNESRSSTKSRAQSNGKSTHFLRP